MGRIYYDEITIAKGIAIVLAVLGHSFPDAVKNFCIAGTDSFASFLFDWIYSFHMYIFFVCAGFLLLPKLRTLHNIKEQIQRRIKRLLIPYFVFSFVYYLLKLFLSSFADHPLDRHAIVLTFLGQSPCFGTWFLWTLFMISITCIILRKIKMMGLLIFSIGILFLSSYITYPLFLSRISNYMIWFVLGGILATTYDKFYLIKYKTILAGSLFLLSLLMCHYGAVNLFVYLFRHLIGISFVWLISFVVTNQTKWLKNILMFLGDFCMDIYMLSMFILVPLRILYLNFGLLDYIPYWIFVFSSSILGIIIPCILSKFIVRKNKILKMLLIGA